MDGLAPGFGIGLSLGLPGGGGSVLTMPALIYLVGQTSPLAVTTSLAIVGANGMVGAMFHSSHGRLDWRRRDEATTYVPAGLVGTFSGMKLSRRLSSSKLQKAFAIFVIALAAFLLFDNLLKLF